MNELGGQACIVIYWVQFWSLSAEHAVLDLMRVRNQSEACFQLIDEFKVSMK